MKKGFTLIEVLGVIVILGIILIITIPIINNSINSSKDKAYKQQLSLIESSAKNYMASNSLELPKEGEYACINLNELQKKGFLSKKDILNPKNPKQRLNGFVKVSFNKNKYTYNYVDRC